MLDAAVAAVIADAADSTSDHGDHGSHPDLPNVIYVDANNSNPGQDGSSWDTAYSSLQDALDAAEASSGGDQIWIAEGRYTPSEIYSPDGVLGGASGLNTDNLKTFNLPDEVQLLGGFQDGMEYLHQRNPDKHVVILDGDLLGNDINDQSDPGYLASKADNAWHVLTASNDVAGTGVSAVVDGLTVMNGFAAGPATPPLTNAEGLRSPHDYGGGMLINWDSDVHVNDVTFINNHANGDGGGMFYNNSDVVVSNSEFINNSAGLRGGAIEAFATEDINTQPHEMLIVSSRFIGNTAFVFGGALVAEGSAADDASRMTVRDSYFEANHALEGGAIVTDSLNVDIEGSYFYKNTAAVNAGALGTTNIVQQLVWADNRFFTTTVSDSVFVENVAVADPGATALINSLFSAPPFLINFGTGGGAVVNYMRGILEIDNSLFLNNSSTYGEGGAILNGDSATRLDPPGVVLEASAETVITRSTFIGNHAVDGGAIASTALDGLQPVAGPLRNTIDISESVFARNTADNRGGALYLNGTHAEVHDNVFWFGSQAGDSGDQIYASDSVVNSYASSSSAAESDVVLKNRFFLLDDDDLEFV